MQGLLIGVVSREHESIEFLAGTAEFLIGQRRATSSMQSDQPSSLGRYVRGPTTRKSSESRIYPIAALLQETCSSFERTCRTGKEKFVVFVQLIEID